MLKEKSKALLRRFPIAWDCYQGIKRQVNRARTAMHCLYDMRRVWRHMYWPPEHPSSRTLSAELLFQYHKLEKGLVMPGKPRLFGTDPALDTMRLLSNWEKARYSLEDPIYAGALATLKAYRSHLTARGFFESAPVRDRLSSFLAEREPHVAKAASEFATPRALPPIQSADDSGPAGAFAALSLSRRSVRDFSDRPVEVSVVERAVSIAALSPSACNRQPNRVLLIRESARIAAALALQNGNRGFGDRIPLLGILTCSYSGFFDGTERHQPYVDGGLFAMSLMLALRSEGLASCPLNWCVTPRTDERLRRMFDLESSDAVIMMIAIGYPADGVMVPLSPRRDLADVLRVI